MGEKQSAPFPGTRFDFEMQRSYLITIVHSLARELPGALWARMQLQNHHGLIALLGVCHRDGTFLGEQPE